MKSRLGVQSTLKSSIERRIFSQGKAKIQAAIRRSV